MSKVNKKFILIMIVIVIIASITYSRFASLGKINLSANVAAWSVKINGRNVTNSSTFTLDEIIWDGNNKVANGYAAPGGNGYYEIKIDTSGTRVAVDYTIGFDASIVEQNTRMKVEKVTFDGVEVTSDNGYYDGYIPLSDVLRNKVITIKIFINWSNTDSDEENYSDVQSVLDYGNIELPIVILVKQHLDDSDPAYSPITQLLPYKETLLRVERPNSGLIISPYYDASMDSLYQNPERGMYNSNTLTLAKNGNTIKDMKAKTSRLLYLKVDLSAFSAWRNGNDEDLSQNAIDTLASQLENIKQNNNTVILRFVYDNNATGIVDGLTKFEPSQTTLLRHIQQLKNVFQQYATTIYTIQVGFYGLWGESYYNTDVNSHPEYYKQTMEALLDATANTEIMIALRTLSYAKTAIKNSNYDTSRVGIFNDALLSQNDDMGTFTNRQEDLEWLNSRNSSYGGEALPATFTDTTESANAYNDTYNSVGGIDNYVNSLKTKTKNWDLISYTENELFKSHTSYINFEWNQHKHYIWANQIYNGKDELYQKSTALEYVQSHLGYRLVIRSVELPRKASQYDKVNASITIENVGFGNVLKSKKAMLLFVDPNDKIPGYEDKIIKVAAMKDITDQFDIKSFKSTQKIKKSLVINIPQLPTSGKYKIFLRISNGEILKDGTYYSAIRLANNNVWNDILQANYIGSMEIS